MPQQEQIYSFPTPTLGTWSCLYLCIISGVESARRHWIDQINKPHLPLAAAGVLKASGQLIGGITGSLALPTVGVADGTILLGMVEY